MIRSALAAILLSLLAHLAWAQVPPGNCGTISTCPPATTPLTGNEFVPLVQNGKTVKALTKQLPPNTQFTSTSTTSATIGTGSFNFTTGLNLGFSAGQFVLISYAANSADYLHGQVTSYNASSGALVVNVTDTGGSGTFASWNITLSGTQGSAGSLQPIANGTVLGNSSGGSASPTAQTVSTGLSLAGGALSCAQGSASIEGCIETDGSTISVAAGVISCTTATTSQKGCLEPDGTTLSISGGTISCTTGTTSQKGCLEPDGTTITVAAGVISASASSPGLAFIASASFSNQSAVTICSSSCTLTNAFGSTYQEYEIHLVNVVPASSGVVLEMLSSTNGGSTYANSSNNYAWAASGVAGAVSIQTYSTGATPTASFSLTGGEELNNAAPGYSAVVKIIGASTGSQYTQVAVRDISWYDETNTTYAATMTVAGAFIASTSAVNAVKILASTGNISGFIALYGVRKQ